VLFVFLFPSMLLVVCPNLAVDRILEVENFHLAKVQRSRPALVQPGGKGSNVARVFRQLGGEVILVGFVGRRNGRWITEQLRHSGIHVDAVDAFDGESRTCTVICDRGMHCHPTVINEESPQIESASFSKLLAKIDKWIPRVGAVLTTGSLSKGLPDGFYASILDRARSKRKLTALDASGESLRLGLLSQPDFIKPNAEEFFQLTRASSGPSVFMLARHTTVTFGEAGALLIHEGTCLFAAPPRVFHENPIGAGDAFTAAYLKGLLDRRPAADCLRLAVSAAASDAATVRPGMIDPLRVKSLATSVEPLFFSCVN
jgi:1-phosphofructokinase family hexose kinase